ncbi:MAG: hypothetical protein ACI9LE_002020, partial [Paraglaciecola sp.]
SSFQFTVTVTLDASNCCARMLLSWEFLSSRAKFLDGRNDYLYLKKFP